MTDMPSKAATVRQGASMQEVADALGPPGNRSFKDNREAWQYCRTTWGKHTFLQVLFTDGRVNEMRTSTDSLATGFCGDAYPPIAWTEADRAAMADAREAAADRQAIIAAGWLAGRPAPTTTIVTPAPNVYIRSQPAPLPVMQPLRMQ